MSEQLTKETVICKRHSWNQTGEGKPVLVKSNLHSRYYRWYAPFVCKKCGEKKVRPQ